jgi:hypothetical protein
MKNQTEIFIRPLRCGWTAKWDAFHDAIVIRKSHIEGGADETLIVPREDAREIALALLALDDRVTP